MGKSVLPLSRGVSADDLSRVLQCGRLGHERCFIGALGFREAQADEFTVGAMARQCEMALSGWAGFTQRELGYPPLFHSNSAIIGIPEPAERGY